VETMVQVGAVAGFILPFFNIPLIVRMVQRKSSQDLSLVWVIGVWICILLMSPAAFTSQDFAFRAFGYTNLVFFSAVAVVSIRYRMGGKS
jgi:uncharacterized protein with PQ loop repeat